MRDLSDPDSAAVDFDRLAVEKASRVTLLEDVTDQRCVEVAASNSGPQPMIEDSRLDNAGHKLRVPHPAAGIGQEREGADEPSASVGESLGAEIVGHPLLDARLERGEMRKRPGVDPVQTNPKMVTTQMTNPELVWVSMALEDLDTRVVGGHGGFGKGKPLCGDGRFVFSTSIAYIPLVDTRLSSHHCLESPSAEARLLHANEEMIAHARGWIGRDLIDDEVRGIAGQATSHTWGTSGDPRTMRAARTAALERVGFGQST